MDNTVINIMVTREQAEQLAQIVANVNVPYVVAHPLIVAIQEAVRAASDEQPGRCGTPTSSISAADDAPEAPDDAREHVN